MYSSDVLGVPYEEASNGKLYMNPQPIEYVNLATGERQPLVLPNSDTFYQEYMASIEQYRDSDYYDMLKNNPYLNYDYNKTVWDFLGDSTGLWHSGEDAVRRDMHTKALAEKQRILELMNNRDYNSEASKQSRLAASGINSDLSGLDAASDAQTPTGPVNPELNSIPESSADAAAFGRGLISSAEVAVSCMSSIGAIVQVAKGLEMVDSQISLNHSQSDAASASALEAESRTASNLFGYAKDFVHSTFDLSDFNTSLSEFGSLYSGDKPWEDLSREEQVSQFIKYRAQKAAVTGLSPQNAKRFNKYVDSLSNPNSLDFQTWVSKLNAQKAEGDLSSAQSLNMLSFFGKGFGDLVVASERAQYEMNIQLAEYKTKLYKQFISDGLPESEASAKSSQLAADKRSSLVTENIASLNQLKSQTLIKFSDWINNPEHSSSLSGLGNWLLPVVSDALEQYIMSIAQSYGSLPTTVVKGAMGVH